MSRTAWIKKREKSLMRILARQCMKDKERNLNYTTRQERNYQDFLFFMRSVLLDSVSSRFSQKSPHNPHDNDSLYLKFMFRDYGFFLYLMTIYELLGEMKEKDSFTFYKPFLVAQILEASKSLLITSWTSGHHNHIKRVFWNWKNRQQQREGGAIIGA